MTEHHLGNQQETCINRNNKFVTTATTFSSVPVIKLQRKCSASWTCSSPTTPNKSRRGSRAIRLKLKPWMAEPLVVKEGDASLRLATDLPRFNWLELKLNQRTDGRSVSPPESSQLKRREQETLEDPASKHPLKLRILANTAPPLSPIRYSASVKMQDQQLTDHAPHRLMPSSPSPTSKWPLKKRFIRSQDEDDNGCSPPLDKVKKISAAANPTVIISKDATYGSRSGPKTSKPVSAPNGEPSSPVQHRPVIMRNVLPPTPPASSAPADIHRAPTPRLVSAVQDKPLDLSSKRCSPFTSPPATPMLASITTRANSNTNASPSSTTLIDDGKAEIEIITMTTTATPLRPPPPPPLLNALGNSNATGIPRSPFGSAPLARPSRSMRQQPCSTLVQQQYQPSLRIGSETRPRPVAIRAPEPTYPEYSRTFTAGSYQQAICRIERAPPSAARPFPLPPPLRPLPLHWKSLFAQQQRGAAGFPIRPEVQLHPVHPMGPPPPPPPPQQQSSALIRTSGGILTVPQARFRHPQTVGTPRKSITNAPSVAPIYPLKPAAPATVPINSCASEWSLRTCVVCSLQADFRCAGCHGNAYCSTACQAKDWPVHSQTCHRSS